MWQTSTGHTRASLAGKAPMPDTSTPHPEDACPHDCIEVDRRDPGAVQEGCVVYGTCDECGEPEHSNGAGWTKTATVADVEFTWFLARRDRHMPSARSLARLEQGVC